MSAYSINSEDLYTTFGVLVSSGSDGLLAFPEPKERFSHDWNDENGIEIDTISPTYFKPKSVSLEIWLTASNEVQFWERWKALFELLGKGIIRLYCDDLARSFYLLFTSSSGTTRLTRIKNNTQIAVKMTLNFIEPDPSFWERFSMLVDKNGNPIITTKIENIIVK